MRPVIDLKGEVDMCTAQVEVNIGVWKIPRGTRKPARERAGYTCQPGSVSSEEALAIS